MNAITPAAAESEAAQAWVLALAEGWRAPANADVFADHFQRWFDPQIRLIEPSLPILVGNEAFRNASPAAVRTHPGPARAGGTLCHWRRLCLH